MDGLSPAADLLANTAPQLGKLIPSLGERAPHTESSTTRKAKEIGFCSSNFLQRLAGAITLDSPPGSHASSAKVFVTSGRGWQAGDEVRGSEREAELAQRRGSREPEARLKMYRSYRLLHMRFFTSAFPSCHWW